MDHVTDHAASGSAVSVELEPIAPTRRRLFVLLAGGALTAGLAALPGADPAAGKKKKRGKGKGKGKKGKGKGKKGGKGGKGNGGGGGTNPLPPSPPASVEEQVLGLINAYRDDEGKGQLTWEDRLGAAAQRHADDMTANHFLSHVGSDNSTPRVRLSDAGYPENVFWGEIIFQSAPNDPTAQSAFTGWKNSPLHNGIMLSEDYTHVGIGQATDEFGVTRWAANFGSLP